MSSAHAIFGDCGNATERQNDDEASYGIISVRAEGADMPTGETMARRAEEAMKQGD